MAANDDEEGKAFAQKSDEMRMRFAHEFFFFWRIPVINSAMFVVNWYEGKCKYWQDDTIASSRLVSCS